MNAIMKYHLPSYYYLSPSQVQHLSFRINIGRNNGAMQSNEIQWQEQISYEDAHEQIYTLTTEEGGVTMLEDEAKRQGRSTLAARIHRDGEDPTSTMVIMARVGNHDEELCVLKMYQHCMISACPALMDDNSCMYSFISPDQDNFFYTIELMLDHAPEEDLFSGSRISEVKRRQLSWTEVDDAEHAFDHQAHVEIVSANGFTQPNILLSIPFGSALVIRYKILKQPSEYGRKQDVVLKGSTNKVQSYDVFSTSIRFLVGFFVAFIGIGSTIIYSLGMSIESGIVPAVLLSIVPLGLLCQFILFGRVRMHHINHQFSLLFRKSSDKENHTTISHQTAMLEMHVYFHHNFGLISLAGSSVTPLPFEPGTYDIRVPTFKPIACSGMSERKCRMQSYYLGTCLNEGLPDPTPSIEDDDVATRLLSRAGLITDGSGTIHLRVNVMKNYFNGAYSKDRISDEQEESCQHRIKVQETVDEVLSRVRRNKRVRMSRSLMVPSSVNPASSRYGTRRIGRRFNDILLNAEEKVETEEEQMKRQDVVL